MLLRGNTRERKRRLDYELLALTVGMILLPCTSMNFTFAPVGIKYSGVLNHMLQLKLSPYAGEIEFGVDLRLSGSVVTTEDRPPYQEWGTF